MTPASRTVSCRDAAGGALVDAGSAVAALGGVDHGDILAGDGVLGADIDACTACDALGSVDCCHLNYLWSSDFRGEYINLPNYELGISENTDFLLATPNCNFIRSRNVWPYIHITAEQQSYRGVND